MNPGSLRAAALAVLRVIASRANPVSTVLTSRKGEAVTRAVGLNRTPRLKMKNLKMTKL